VLTQHTQRLIQAAKKKSLRRSAAYVAVVEYLDENSDQLSKSAIAGFCEELVMEGFRMSLVSGAQVGNNCM